MGMIELIGKPEGRCAYSDLVAKLVRISHDLGGHRPADCDGREPSEEYLAEYAESVDAKYPPEEGDDAWTEDAKWDMDCCEQCGNEECAVVKLRRLVDELKEDMDNAKAKGL